LIQASKNGAITVCGGGDTASMINSFKGAKEHIYHLSTGGGASLELLEGRMLPGITYLSDIKI
jgi:phosphoglycerate kinase